MSSTGYYGLLYRVSQKLEDLSKVNQILYTSRSDGLIAEDSESYNVQVNPGDNIAVIVMKLFSDLEEQDNLGIDNLDNLRIILVEVREWSLIAEVDKFARQRQEFNTLLKKIIAKLDEHRDILAKVLMPLCADHISEDVKDGITDVGSLFKELDKKKRLGVGRLAILKMILNETGEQELLDALMEFENKGKTEEVSERRKDRAAEVANTVIARPAAVLLSTVKHVWDGAVKILCNFSASGVPLIVGAGLILNRAFGYSLGEFAEFFNRILPLANQLRTFGEGSVCFTVQAENRPALEALWKRYQDGTLQRSLQEFLVTDDIKQLADGEEVVLTAHIDEQDYNNACLSFIIAEKEVLDNADQYMPLKRARRNSDSILYVRTKENESTLVQLKLRQEEIKFHQEKLESLEKEIKRLKAQIEEAASDRHKESTPAGEAEYLSWRRDKEIQEKLGIKRFRAAAISDLEIEEIRGKEFEGLESPRKRPRRNSDSNLYCKATVEEMREREPKKHDQFLGDEKYAFFQRYPEEAHETHSVVTSDSGHVTHGAPFELGMEDIPEDAQKLYLKDLSKDVTSELETRLEGDEDAMRRILQSFGVTDPSRLNITFGDILDFFPNTPVKLLKDVFEALQLYDLLDLLEKPTKPLPSLRTALTLNDIKKLRNTANRPTTYHNCAAVLIITPLENDTHVRDLKKFFTDIDTVDTTSVVTIPKNEFWKLETRERIITDVQNTIRQQEAMIKIIISGRMQSQGQPFLSKMWQQETAMELTRGSRFMRQTMEQLKEERRYEHETIVHQKAIIERIRSIMKRLRYAPKQQQQTAIALSDELQLMRKTMEQLKTRLKVIEERREESEERKQAALAVIDGWIKCQDDFSFFAVFDFASSGWFSPGWSSFPEVISKLESGIPDKTKFVVGSGRKPKKLSQALVVTGPLHANEDQRLLLEILNKRWQTLDLISMMSEFKRSVHGKNTTRSWGKDPVTITDTLSSLPSFKRNEDLS